MTTLLAVLLLAGSTGDCAQTRTDAAEAYAAARQETSRAGEAADLLRAARNCTLAEGDTARAAGFHTQEINLLWVSGAPQRTSQSVQDYFATFTPRHHLARYTYVMRIQAHLDIWRGDAAEAFALLHRCLAMTPVTWARERAETHLRIAELHRTLNQYAEAATHTRLARDLIDRHLTGREREQQRVRALITLTETLLQWYALEDVPVSVLDEAHRAALQAYDLREYAWPADRVYVKHMLGDVLTYTGDLEGARILLREAVEQTRDGDQQQYVTALYRLGRTRLRAGDLAEARIALETAFEQALQQGFFTWARRIRNDQGRLEMRSGDFARAKDHYRDAIALVEDLRAEIGTTEWAASSVSDWQAPYRGLARVLVAEDSLAAAIEVLEQSRARHLLALQARLAHLDATAAARADSLMAELADVRNALRTASGPQMDGLHARTAEIQERLNEVVGPPPPRQTLDLAVLQTLLRRDDRTVVYYVLDHEDRLFEGEDASYAFVIQADTLTMHPLPIKPASVALRLAEVGAAVRGDTSVAGSEALSFSLDALHTLHRDLMEPFAALLPEGGPLTIVPDGALFALPFAALVTKPAGRFAYAQGDYLGAHHPITIELSLSGTLSPPPPAHTSTELLVVGKSHFADAALAPLPGVAREVRQVTARFGHARTLMDARATETDVGRRVAGSRIIHFATHAVLDRTSPLYHALVLTPAPHTDALLHLHEIEQMHLQAELVTLSGCNTARGNLNAGEGMAGLQYAFRAVGARSTVSTLWSLSDEAGAALFGDFYRYLANGLPKDVALQRAQQQYREAHPAASPFFWASPVLYGSPSPLHVVPSRAYPLWPVLLLVGFGVLVLFIRRHRARSSHSASAHATKSPL